MLFAAVRGLAATGSLQAFRADKKRVLSVVIYAKMGWPVVAARIPLRTALGPAGFVWPMAGDLLYSVGLMFYALDGRVAHLHGNWHLFVLAGSPAHCVAIPR